MYLKRWEERKKGRKVAYIRDAGMGRQEEEDRGLCRKLGSFGGQHGTVPVTVIYATRGVWFECT